MEHTTGIPPLTTVQQCVVNALAAGSTLTDAAESFGVHRVTVYRWMKTCKPFAAALHRARAKFVLARRDDLYHLSNRALETLLAVLDNSKSSPAVLLRTAMFILQRPQLPKTGWSMPEPAPDPDGNKLLDSAIIEQDYDSLPGLCNIERDIEPDDPADPPTETSSETEAPAESIVSDPAPPPESPAPPTPSMPTDAAECNQMQHDSRNCDDVAPDAPAPLEVSTNSPYPDPVASTHYNGRSMPHHLRHAICNELFENQPFAEACRDIRQAGYTGIEIAPFTLAEDPATIPSARRRECRDIIASEGLQFVGLHWLMVSPQGLHVTTPDADIRRRSWQHIRHLIDLCADLGPDGMLVFGSPHQRSDHRWTQPRGCNPPLRRRPGRRRSPRRRNAASPF